MCKETELQRVKVCIDTVDTLAKPTTAQTAMINQRIGTSVSELTIEELAGLVVFPHSRTWTPAEIIGERSNDNWRSQQVFALDFDKGYKLGSALTRLEEFGLSCNFCYSTFNSTDELSKFRLVFVLDKPTSDKAIRDEIMLALLMLFPEADGGCKDAARMFYGGKKISYANYEYRVKSSDIIESAEMFYLGDAKKNTLTRRLKKLGEKRHSNKTIIDRQKYPNHKEIRRFDWNSAEAEVQILKDFMSGEWLCHPQLFGIATNLLYVSGGLMKMKELMERTGKYTQNNFNILSYVKNRNYSPQQLCHFSPYQEDHRHRNILDAGKLQKGAVRRTTSYKTISLKEGELKLKEVFENVQNSADRKIHIICAPTSIGKTRIITQQQNAIVGFPDHALKDEVSNIMQVDHASTPNLMDYLDEEDRKYVEHCYKVGAHRRAACYIYKKKSIPAGYSTQPGEQAYREYQQKLTTALNSEGTILTTHAKLQSIDDEDRTIYFDEDPFTSAFLTMHDAYISDIKYIMLGVKDLSDRGILSIILDNASHAPQNTLVEMPEFAFNDYTEVENLAVRNRNMLGNILDFLNCKHFLIDHKDMNKLHFIKQNLPVEGRKIVIFSATANEWIYRQLFGARVEFHYVDQVELQGKLVQDTTFSFSRNNVHKKPGVIKYALEKVEDRMVITFQEFAKHFKNVYTDIYFGNCQGKDKYQDKPLAIVGTPHVSPAVYYLYSKYLGLEFKPEDFRQEMHRVHRNGLFFNFFTFEDERLRTLQFYFIERELKQAIGRGRPIRRSDADILVLSNYPLPEAVQLNEI